MSEFSFGDVVRCADDYNGGAYTERRMMVVIPQYGTTKVIDLLADHGDWSLNRPLTDFENRYLVLADE